MTGNGNQPVLNRERKDQPPGGNPEDINNTTLHRKENPELTGIFLETAHPAKFRESVEEVIGETVELPERLAAFADREKEAVSLQPDYQDFKQYLLDRI